MVGVPVSVTGQASKSATSQLLEGTWESNGMLHVIYMHKLFLSHNTSIDHTHWFERPVCPVIRPGEPGDPSNYFVWNGTLACERLPTAI